MIGSLNPIDYASSINSLPQLHLSGGRDRKVPPFISQDYIIASNNSKCVKGLMNKNATHLQNWEKYFQKNKVIEPRCD
ncbi:MAG: hypothetical protein EB127_16935 [Alphaproteobacteria bacterium]|nr:hypothetical protein [Alphaproteobacteria bacterium]